MSNRVLDINCDMGESFGNWRIGNDTAVMPKITTANVACGFHAGDPVTMMKTVELAKAHNVTVGAHPGVPDLLGFGRRVMAVSPTDVYAYISYQVGALQAFVRGQQLNFSHVKPHGAMFHLMRNDELADAALDAIIDVAPGAAVYWPGPMGREIFTTKASKRGLRVVAEAYPDLDYTSDGSLIVEREKRPVDGKVVYGRVKRILTDGHLEAKDGTILPMEVESVCIHGDGPNVTEVLDAVHRAAADCDTRVACATA